MTHSSIQSLMRHEKYYIPSADLSILVERVQFRVHRYFLERESEYFRRQLVTPASPGSQPQGTNDSTAIILADVTPTEFARFLWVFYNPRYSLYDEASCEDWQSILHLAHRWLFPEVKKLAIRELELQWMLDVKRIKLYQDNEVDRRLLVPRYAALCEREETLSLEEGFDLGMETTLMIARGREQARSQRLPTGGRSPLTPTVHGSDLIEIIRELFKLPAGEDDVGNPGTAHLPPSMSYAPPANGNGTANGHTTGGLNQKLTGKMMTKPSATNTPNPLTPATTPTPAAQAPPSVPNPAQQKPTGKPQPPPSTKTPTGQKAQAKAAKGKATTAIPSTPTLVPIPPQTATSPPPPPAKEVKQQEEVGRVAKEGKEETKGVVVVEPVAGQQAVDGLLKEGGEAKEEKNKAVAQAPKVDDAKTDVANVDAGNVDAVVDAAKEKKTDEVDKSKVDAQGEVAKEAQAKAETKVNGVTKDDAKVEVKKEEPLLVNTVTAVPTSNLIDVSLPVFDHDNALPAPAPEQTVKSPNSSTNPFSYSRPPPPPSKGHRPPSSPSSLENFDSVASSLMGGFSNLWGGGGNNNKPASGGMPWNSGNTNIS